MGNPVGKGASVGSGVSVGVGEAVGNGELVGVSEPFGVGVMVGGGGVQVIKTTLSAPLYVAVIDGSVWFGRVKTVDNQPHMRIRINDPITTRNTFAPRLCFENQAGNLPIIFMFIPFHL